MANLEDWVLFKVFVLCFTSCVSNVCQIDPCSICGGQSVSGYLRDSSGPGSNLPRPDYHWDITGKCSKDEYCRDTSCSSKKIYALAGDKSATLRRTLHAITRYATKNATCGLSFGYGDSLDLGDFKGTCVSQPELCPGGLSVTFWMKVLWYQTIIGESFLLASGGHTRNSRGFSVSVQRYRLQGLDQWLLHTTVKLTNKAWYGVINGMHERRVNLPVHPVPYDTWFHYGFTWHPRHGLKIYVNGHMTYHDMGKEFKTEKPNYNLKETHLYLNSPNDNENRHSRAAYNDLKIFERALMDSEVKAIYDDSK